MPASWRFWDGLPADIARTGRSIEISKGLKRVVLISYTAVCCVLNLLIYSVQSKCSSFHSFHPKISSWRVARGESRGHPACDIWPAVSGGTRGTLKDKARQHFVQRLVEQPYNSPHTAPSLRRGSGMNKIRQLNEAIDLLVYFMIRLFFLLYGSAGSFLGPGTAILPPSVLAAAAASSHYLSATLNMPSMRARRLSRHVSQLAGYYLPPYLVKLEDPRKASSC